MYNNKVGFVSLGCPKALVDSERIITQLKFDGYDLVSQYSEANVVIVNTCGFIDEAKKESIDVISEAMDENGQVIVTGCMGTSSDANRLKDAFPDLLAITGPAAYEEVMTAVHKTLPPVKEYDPLTNLIPKQGIKLTPRHYAYLKISEGCNHHCKFCIIPSLRGDLVSRPIGDIMREAEGLVNSGVRELLVIAQDTSAYGVDLSYKTDFWKGAPLKSDLYTLCKSLGTLGVWIRLHYVYPYPHVDKIIPLMLENRILPYLDIPLQHGSPTVLKRMARPAGTEKTLNRINSWRKICPNLNIRSTFIVGYPGETDSEFEELLLFLEEAQLDRVGCFKYSPVSGAAANDLPYHIPDDVKEERLGQVMDLQKEISIDKLNAKIGIEDHILIDEINSETAIGRTKGDSPNIDGVVFLKGASGLSPGDFTEVKITGSSEHDLWAERL